MELLERFELTTGEQLVRQPAASSWGDGVALGGHLVLTNQGLVFIPHSFNLSRSVWPSPVSAVTGCADRG